MAIKATETTYNGNPMLKLEWEGEREDKYPLQLGVGKAKKALAGHDLIKAFVERHKNDPKPQRNQGPQGGPQLNPDGTRADAGSYRGGEPEYRS